MKAAPVLHTRDGAAGPSPGAVASARSGRATPRFDNINLLRAFAALAVVTYHVIEKAHWSSFPVHGPLLVFRIGWIGVDLFFVISGFVVTYSAILLYRGERDRFGYAFWSRRLARIVPLHLLTMAVWIAVVEPAFLGLPLPRLAWHLVAHATFIHNLSTVTHDSINGVNWTLAVEMQFYLVIALLIRWIERTPGWRIWMWATVIAWSWRAAMFVIDGDKGTWHTFVASTELPGQLDLFGAGIFLAKLVLVPRERRTFETWLWLLGAVVAGYVAMAVYWPWASYWQYPWMVIFWRTSSAALMLCVVASAVWLPQAIARRWLRPLNYLGEISYGIYLWQLIAIGVATEIAGSRPPVVLVLALALTIVVSGLSWRFFEKVIMDRVRALGGGLGRRKSTARRALRNPQ